MSSVVLLKNPKRPAKDLDKTVLAFLPHLKAQTGFTGEQVWPKSRQQAMKVIVRL